MKPYILLILCNIICIGVTAQSFQYVNNTSSSALTNKYFFYTSAPDTAVNHLVKNELRSLSAYFFITPACYYYDTVTTFSKELIKPNFQNDNIYLDLNMLQAETNQTLKNNILINLTHQFAWIVAKKYKLNLSFLQQVLFTDYITGIYMGNKYPSLRKRENYYDSQSLYLNFANDPSFNLTKENRMYAFKKGEADFLIAYQRRHIYTLRDIISEGINLVMSQDLE
ncbi:MAG: hypothetical protein JWP67_481 [Mucilaginibacter sp.]|nr:hypothetical protein [Mucilaginibacter sp.]MDB5060638.1 hypothetical protein [Mucilaginibacter sp.]